MSSWIGIVLHSLFIVYRCIRKSCVFWNQITSFGCVSGNDNSNCVRLYYVIFGLLFFFSGGKHKTKTSKFCTFWEGVSVNVVCMFMVCLYIFVVVCFLFQLSSWKYIKYHTYRIYIIGSFTLLFLLGIYVVCMNIYGLYIECIVR